MIRGTPFLRNYTVRDYKAYHQNWACAQDSAGIMYFANNNGILEFDGVEWDLCPVANRSTVRALAVDAENTLYVGAQGEFGLATRDAYGRLGYRSLRDSVPDSASEFADVWSVHPTSAGVYFRTKKLIFRWFDRRLHVIRSPTAFHRSYLIRDTVYVNQEGIGLCRVSGDDVVLLPGGGRFSKSQVYVLLPYAESGLLVGTSKEGFFVFDGGQFRVFQPSSAAFLQHAQIYNATMLPSGLYAVATLNRGLVVLNDRGEVLSVVDKSAGLINEKVHNVFADRQGAVWLALDNGLSRVEVSSPFSIVGEESGLHGNVQSMARYNGRLYVATSTGLFRADISDADRPSAPVFSVIHQPGTQCWSLLVIGNSLLCASNTGVWEIRGETIRPIERGTSFLLERSRRDSQVVYVAMKDGLGLLRMVHGRLSHAGRVKGLTGEIRAIMEDSSRVWLGSKYQGVWSVALAGGVHEESAFVRYDTSDGLPKGWIRTFRVAGRLILTSEYGLFRFDPASNRFMPDSTFGTDYVGQGAVSPLYEDRHGCVWLTTGRDVARAWQEGGTYRIENSPMQRIPEEAEINVLYEDVSERYWIGGTLGLIGFDGRMARPTALPTSTRLRRAATLHRDSLLAVDGSVRPDLSHALNAVRFEFALPAFDNETGNMFQFKLEGFDTHWSEWTIQSKKEYTNLPGGEYVFRVRGRDIYGQEAATASFGFSVHPPWYWSWPSILMYLGTAGLILYGGVRWRVRWLEEQNRSLESKVTERTRELQETQVRLIHSEKMASLGQMVAGMAHEINNPLTFVYSNQEFIKDRVEKLFVLTDALENQLSNGSSGDGSTTITRLKADMEYDHLREDLQEAVRSSVYGSQRIKSIVENLRSFANLDEKPFRPADLNANIEVIVDLFLKSHEDIEFVRELGDVPPIDCNPGEINQSVLNILRNSVQAIDEARAEGQLSGRGRITITTSVSDEPGGRCARLSVQDNGTGIPGDVLDKVFDPFFTTRKVGFGRGLGLTEAYGVIRKHRGTIDIRNRNSGGTEAVITIPYGLSHS